MVNVFEATIGINAMVFSCPDRVCEQLNGPLFILKSISIVDPGHLWPLRHLIRVMRKHDLTNKKTTTKTKTKKMTMTNAFKAIFETCDLSNICRVMRKRQRQRQKQRHLENTFKKRFFTVETIAQSNEKTWPDQQKDNDKDDDMHNHNTNTWFHGTCWFLLDFSGTIHSRMI